MAIKQFAGPPSHVQAPPGLPPVKQLEAAGRLSHMSKDLHPAVEINLKLWPYSIDPQIEGSTCKVDLGLRCEHQEQASHVNPSASAPGSTCGVCGHTIGHQVVSYDWADSKRGRSWVPKRPYKHRLTELDKMVKRVLGAGFALFVQLNGIQIWPTQPESLSRGRRKPSPRKVTKRRPGAKVAKRRPGKAKRR